MSTVTMTWPQYRRGECRYKGHLTRLAPQEAEVVLGLLVRGVGPTPAAVLADLLWGDRVDGGVLDVQGHVRTIMRRLGAKLPGAIGGRAYFGWYIKQEGTPMDTIKMRLAAAVERLPDDLGAAVLLYPDAERAVRVTSLADVPQALQLLGAGTARIGSSLQRA